jgi:hypothetical protein
LCEVIRLKANVSVCILPLSARSAADLSILRFYV